MLRIWVEIILVAILVILAFSEIVIPLWRDRPLFPLFGKRRKLEKELGVAEDAVETAALKRRVKEARKPERN